MPAHRTRADSLRWMAQGTKTFVAALAALPDDRLDGPTVLSGWTGKHLLAHVAANADALVNLAHWARTGEQTPMYSSPQQRDADIEASATRPAAELRAWTAQAAATLDARLAELDEQQWTNQVRTAQGRNVPAEEIPWMRAREVMVHAVDLGVGFDDLAADFLAALIDDITAKRSAGGEGPPLTLTATDNDGTWAVAGTGDPTPVTGTLASLTAYLSGRPTDGVTGPAGQPAPELPRWL
ncbi:maleylpyruvate isomerase family mycothiol-dependent enzyme [Micromonospora sp. NPDC005163]